MELRKKFVIKQNDTFPPIIVQALGDDGKPLDLTDCTATFVISEEVNARPIVYREGRILEDGKIQLDWHPGDTNIPGKYLLEVIITNWRDAPEVVHQFTLPGAGYAEVIITPRLWDGPVIT